MEFELGLVIGGFVGCLSTAIVLCLFGGGSGDV